MMFAIGLILVVLAIIVIAYVVFATSDLPAMDIDWGIFTAALSPLQLFFLGAVTVLVLAIGCLMAGIGLKRAGAKRAEVRRLRKEVKSQEPSTKQGKNDAKAATKRGEDSQGPESGHNYESSQGYGNGQPARDTQPVSKPARHDDSARRQGSANSGPQQPPTTPMPQRKNDAPPPPPPNS